MYLSRANRISNRVTFCLSAMFCKRLKLLTRRILANVITSMTSLEIKKLRKKFCIVFRKSTLRFTSSNMNDTGFWIGTGNCCKFSINCSFLALIVASNVCGNTEFVEVPVVITGGGKIDCDCRFVDEVAPGGHRLTGPVSAWFKSEEDEEVVLVCVDAAID